jgi:VanZ family protein
MTSKNSLLLILRLSAPAIWALIILWLSLTSSPPQIKGALGWDKFLHAAAYGLLSLLLAQAFITFQQPRKTVWWAGSFAVVYGGGLEILQMLAHTGRTAEWWDLFADAVGAFLGCVIFRHTLNLLSHHNETLGRNNG